MTFHATMTFGDIFKIKKATPKQKHFDQIENVSSL